MERLSLVYFELLLKWGKFLLDLNSLKKDFHEFSVIQRIYSPYFVLKVIVITMHGFGMEINY